MAMMSTARLIEKMKRLGVSSGSHGSFAPVSPLAQPPSSAAAARTAMVEWRARTATVFKNLSTIEVNDSQSGRFSRRWRECRTPRVYFEECPRRDDQFVAPRSHFYFDFLG